MYQIEYKNLLKAFENYNTLKFYQDIKMVKSNEDIIKILNDIIESKYGDELIPAGKFCDIFENVCDDDNEIDAFEDMDLKKKLTYLIENVEFCFDIITSNVNIEKYPTISITNISLQEINFIVSNFSNSVFENIQNDIDVNRLNIYENLPVNIDDKFKFKITNKNYNFSEKLVLLLKHNTNEVIGVGNINNGYICLKSNNINYIEMSRNNNYRIGFIKQNEYDLFIQKNNKVKIYTITSQLTYNEVTESQTPLCIDFGTSNTTAGTYIPSRNNDDTIKLVSFYDITKNSNESKLYPTIVYVNKIDFNSNQVEYLFGYSALKKVVDNGYNPKASVFFEIKRWINTLDDFENIYDEDGNCIKVKRREIIKAYLLNIIELANHFFKTKFKKLHLSSPVKLKELFLQEFEEIFKEENLEIFDIKTTVDEGFALIYNAYLNMVNRFNLNQGDELEESKIIILDCGGGTTEFVECSINLTQNNGYKVLDIKSKFVNGNSNFGGNNITFRILQLLKIKLVNENFKIKEYIPYIETQILQLIDKSINDKKINFNLEEIYKKFDELYLECEQFIPTIFNRENSSLMDTQVELARRNYYYLWQLAEKIKIMFFEDDILILDLKSLDLVDDYINVYNENQELVPVKNLASKLVITITEIRKVLYGDIYGILNELLYSVNSFNNDDNTFYRLAGQSCKINLFSELLKEFIPGKYLRNNDDIGELKRKEDEISYKNNKFKLHCIEGCIGYIRDKERGEMKPNIEYIIPELIYCVSVRANHHILTADGLNLARYTKSSNLVTATIQNFNGVISRSEITFKIDEKNNKPIENLEYYFENMCDTSYDFGDNFKQINNIFNEISDIKDNDEPKIIFAIPSRQGYGLTIYAIYKEVVENDHKYYELFKSYYDYEDESTQSFFDGKR